MNPLDPDSKEKDDLERRRREFILGPGREEDARQWRRDMAELAALEQREAELTSKEQERLHFLRASRELEEILAPFLSDVARPKPRGEV